MHRSVALGECFLVAAAFSIDVSGTDTDPHKRVMLRFIYRTLITQAVSVVLPDLCIMRDRPA